LLSQEESQKYIFRNNVLNISEIFVLSSSTQDNLEFHKFFTTDVYYATWFRPDLQKAFTGKVA